MRGKKTGGRRAGTANRTTAALKDYARTYDREAIDGLVRILRAKKAPHIAKVAAARELLDRGHGKAAQAHTGEDGGPVQVQTTIVHQHELAR